MNRLFLLLLCIFTLTVNAQDVIICKNGDEILSKVLKVSKSEIEYKKWTNQDGPSYTLDKSEVFMIKYQSGDKDVFKDEPVKSSSTAVEKQSAQEEPTSNEPILATAAPNNAELIAEYNNEIHEYADKYFEKPKKKKAKSAIGTLGVLSSSILSTDDIEISIRQAQELESNPCFALQHDIGEEFEVSALNACWSSPIKSVIEITNKSSKVIYIDKGSCFRTSSFGEIRPYYKDIKISSVSGGGNSMGLNMGAVTDALGIGGAVSTLASGVNVGGHKGNSTIVEHQMDRFIVIPPKGKALLSKDDYIDKKGKDIITGVSEYFFLSFGDLLRNEFREFTEESSPEKWNYVITYSTTPDFSKINYLHFGLYLKDVMGATTMNGLYLRELNKIFKTRSSKTIVIADWYL